MNKQVIALAAIFVAFTFASCKKQSDEELKVNIPGKEFPTVRSKILDAQICTPLLLTTEENNNAAFFVTFSEFGYTGKFELLALDNGEPTDQGTTYGDGNSKEFHWQWLNESHTRIQIFGFSEYDVIHIDTNGSRDVHLVQLNGEYDITGLNFGGVNAKKYTKQVQGTDCPAYFIRSDQ